MLNVFPGLLTYGFFAPTLLRIAAAIVLFYLAYNHYTQREHIARTHFPVFGAKTWIAWVAIFVDVVVGLGLFFGAWTQVAALLGALIALKYGIWYGKYPSYFVLPRSTAFLLCIVCLSLMLTGAGAMAFDVPL